MERKFVKDLVSVITPVYNAERFIGQTLESMLAQTYENIEFILVDDCSSDNSAQIIQSYKKQYSNIVYHLQEQNMGAGVARNKALEIARGQYVAFLDSDDLWIGSYTAVQLLNEVADLIIIQHEMKRIYDVLDSKGYEDFKDYFVDVEFNRR